MELEDGKKYVDGTGRVISVSLTRPGMEFPFDGDHLCFSYKADGAYISGELRKGTVTDFNLVRLYEE